MSAATQGLKKISRNEYIYRGVVITRSDAYKGHWDFTRRRADGTTYCDTWEGLRDVKYFIDKDFELLEEVQQ